MLTVDDRLEWHAINHDLGAMKEAVERGRVYRRLISLTQRTVTNSLEASSI